MGSEQGERDFVRVFPSHRLAMGRSLVGLRWLALHEDAQSIVSHQFVPETQEAAMEYTLVQNSFSAREEAVADIAARGWHALEYDLPAQEDELHWHDYDSVTFVLGGTCRIVFEDGTVMECEEGARIEQPAGVLHRSGNLAYQAVFGFSVALEEMSLPICKPAAELGSRLTPN